MYVIAKSTSKIQYYLIALINCNCEQNGAEELTDEEVIKLVKYKRIQAYKLETVLGNPERGVNIR